MEITFDDYLSNRVGMGFHQQRAFIILSMIEFMSGFQEIFQGILVRILTTEWKITKTQQMLLGTFYFTGIMIGNIVCSFFADRYGRRKLLLFSQFGSSILMFGNSFATDYLHIQLTILFYGIFFGISMPISQVIVGEIVPLKIRGRYIVLLQLIYIFGILYLQISCILFLKSFDSGNWRGLLRLNTLPGFFCLFLTLLFLRESPRLLIAKGSFEQGFYELDQMGRLNKKTYPNITLEEKEALISWQKQFLNQEMQARSFKGIVSKGNLKISLFIWSIYSFFNIVSCGMLIITPYIYNDSGSSFKASSLAFLSEIPGIFFAMILIDSLKYGGRIRVIMYGLILLIIVQLTIYIWENNVIVIGQMAQRFGIRVVWSSLNALPAESYSTTYRSMGVGLAQGIGKVSGALSSFIVLPLYYQETYLPFLICAGFSLMTLIITFYYPLNTTQKELDQGNKDEIEGQNKEIEEPKQEVAIKDEDQNKKFVN